MYLNRLKKTIFSFIIAAGLVCTAAVMPAFAEPTEAADAAADSTIKMYVNDEIIEMDTAPFIENGRTMVPARFATEPIGAVLGWEGGEVQKASVRKGNKLIAIYVGNNIATVNDVEHELDAAAALRDGRVFVPMRFIGESLDCDVKWNAEEKAVYIYTIKQIPPTEQQPDTPAEYRDFDIYGYYYTSVSKNDTTTYKDEMTGLAHFGYTVTADGTVKENKYFASDGFYNANGPYSVAKGAGLDVMMLVTGFSRNELSSMLSSATARAKAVADITRTVTLNGLAGVDIDFESVATDQRDNFSKFVKELRESLGKNKTIVLSLMPRSSAGQFWLDGYDYYTLSLYADKLNLMCYNEHYSGGSPGPVASNTWLIKVLDYTTGLGVPAEKIVCALGCYGYNWPKGSTGSSTTNTNARNVAAKYGATIYRDPESGCPFFTYTSSDGRQREVWFEDSYSMAAKAKIAFDYGCAGIGIWRLGFLTDEIWAQMLGAINHPNAEKWLDLAPAAPDFPVKDVDTEGGITMENNGELVQEGI